MTDWNFQPARQEGPFRMYWRDGSYTDYRSRAEALHSAGDPDLPIGRAQRLKDETSVVLEGEALSNAVLTRRVAALLYEALRLDKRRQDLGLRLDHLRWEGDDALYPFS